jgi:hypothetical protein
MLDKPILELDVRLIDVETGRPPTPGAAIGARKRCGVVLPFVTLV